MIWGYTVWSRKALSFNADNHVWHWLNGNNTLHAIIITPCLQLLLFSFTTASVRSLTMSRLVNSKGPLFLCSVRISILQGPIQRGSLHESSSTRLWCNVCEQCTIYEWYNTCELCIRVSSTTYRSNITHVSSASHVSSSTCRKSATYMNGVTHVSNLTHVSGATYVSCITFVCSVTHRI